MHFKPKNLHKLKPKSVAHQLYWCGSVILVEPVDPMRIGVTDEEETI